MLGKIKTDYQVVYEKLLKRELSGWDELDNFLESLEYLTDDELYRECNVAYINHEGQEIVCDYEHNPNEKCFMPILVGVAGTLIDFYQNGLTMDAKDKYILQYYLGLTEAKYIQVRSKI